MAPYTSQLTHAYTFSFLSNTHQYIDSWSSNKRRTPQSLLSLLDNLISFCWQPKSAICYKRTVTAVAHVYVAIHISQFVYIFTYTYTQLLLQIFEFFYLFIFVSQAIPLISWHGFANEYATALYFALKETSRLSGSLAFFRHANAFNVCLVLLLCLYTLLNTHRDNYLNKFVYIWII